jgi:hypothetical protein
MLNIAHDERPHSRVTVAFADGPLSFLLSKDAAFEDLADRLQRLGERHRGKPIAIDVKLAAAPAPRDRQAWALAQPSSSTAAATRTGAAGAAINSAAVGFCS